MSVHVELAFKRETARFFMGKKTLFQNLFQKKRGPFDLFLLALFFILGATKTALADPTGDGGCSSPIQSLGDMFGTIASNALPFGNLFSWVAYAVGALMTMQGVYYFRLHNESPQNNRLTTPVMLWVGACCLLALPTAAATFISAVYGTAPTGGSTLITVCSGNATSGGTSLDTMVTGFVSNIKTPLLSLVSIIAILCGVFMMVNGLIKAGKYGMDAKTNSIQSILTNIIFGALLITIGDNQNMIMASVFGTSTITDPNQAVLNWGFVSQLGASQQFTSAIGSALNFVQLIGAIAFVRGWLVMKKVVEGGGNVTMAQGVTHIIGGALAMNIATFINIMSSTFGTTQWL